MLNENASKEEMLKNVERSTQNALNALTQFEKSLIQGRFKEGINSYQVLCNTLLGQKIWSSDKDNQAINDNFEKIAATAKNIVDILQPYVESLEKLTNVDGDLIFEHIPTENTGNQQGKNEVKENDESRLMQIISSSPKKQITYTKLRSSLGWDRKKLDTTLNALTKRNNKVSITQKNSRKMVSLL